MTDLFDYASATGRGPSAVISGCGRYRYRLERPSAGIGATAVIMVNPSTADATENDATIRKLLGFGARHSWGTILVGNLFAWRATDVRELTTAWDPVGPLNDLHLRAILADADRVLVAWGPVAKVPPALRDRWRQVVKMIDEAGHQPLAIGKPVAGGQPRHPLMPSYEEPIAPWVAP